MDLKGKITSVLLRTAAVAAVLIAASLPLRAQYDKDVFSFRGRSALAEGRLSEALNNFNILVQLDTTDYWTFFYRGITKYNLGDIRGARADFNTAVRLNPVFTNGYHYRAITSSRSGNYDDALKDLQRAIELRPGASGLYYTRGVTYFLSGQFSEAVGDFDRYIRKERKDPSAYLNRGASYLFLGDTLKALDDYNKAIKLDRFEPECYIRRGRLFASQGDMDGAIEDMDMAISLDSLNSLAYFNRALFLSEKGQPREAMSDLDKVLDMEPGNALTLYNRSLIKAQVGDFEGALEDMDRVININPGNVLAYFNRAGFFVEMARWDDALADYNKAIELYPDFAKAYMNRSFVELQMGMKRASRADWQTAQNKVREYRSKTSTGEAVFADTTLKYSSLLALDADFARKDFDDEMLQYRDVDINLKPLFKFVLSAENQNVNYALKSRFENPLLDRFTSTRMLPIVLTDDPSSVEAPSDKVIDEVLYGSGSTDEFLLALSDVRSRQFNSAMAHYNAAIENEDDRYAIYYKGFYYMNRAVLRAEMIDFIASIESNVQTLSMDDKGAARARVREQISTRYDYTEAVEDMEQAVLALPGIPYVHYNMGNLLCLSSRLVEAIESYNKAISLYPALGEAYFNRGLVLIYLKDKEKGCIDLSRAGELGIEDSYSVIHRYCKEEN